MSLFKPGSSLALTVLSKIRGVGASVATVVLENYSLPQLAGNVTREELAELRLNARRVGFVAATNITDLLSL